MTFGIKTARQIAGLLLLFTPLSTSALELGACETERNKIVFVLKSVFQPYLKDNSQLPYLRQDIIDLSNSLNGWVEDIDACYRTVFRQYGAPVDHHQLNNGLDWSAQLVVFNGVIQKASQHLQQESENEDFWPQLNKALNDYLPDVFIPGFRI
ncbi:hypothetical protein [Hahella ganghwensis]|uniref:hypothetical protein n=1 Tax=Hahella ganghwensis TaxID=286420 RepID=UPI00035FDA1F|nr:hypothetical protein [Hahella ganghwensis]